jgi:hypothetical protein
VTWLEERRSAGTSNEGEVVIPAMFIGKLFLNDWKLSRRMFFFVVPLLRAGLESTPSD